MTSASAQPASRKTTLPRSVISDAFVAAAVVGGALYAADEKPVPHFMSRVVPIVLIAVFVEALLARRFLRKEESEAPQSQASAIFGAVAGAAGVGYFTWIILWAGWRGEVRWPVIAVIAFFAGLRRYWSARKLPNEGGVTLILALVVMAAFAIVRRVS